MAAIDLQFFVFHCSIIVSLSLFPSFIENRNIKVIELPEGDETFSISRCAMSSEFECGRNCGKIENLNIPTFYVYQAFYGLPPKFDALIIEFALNGK